MKCLSCVLSLHRKKNKKNRLHNQSQRKANIDTVISSVISQQICEPVSTRTLASRVTTFPVRGKGCRIGFGVSVRPQEGMGNGLLATKQFEKGDVITQYEGYIIGRREAEEMGSKATHIISIGPIIIDGFKDPSNLKGRGGGSFVNHSSQPNARYVADGNGHIFVKAIALIPPQQFIMCQYSKSYFVRFSF